MKNSLLNLIICNCLIDILFCIIHIEFMKNMPWGCVVVLGIFVAVFVHGVDSLDGELE